MHSHEVRDAVSLFDMIDKNQEYYIYKSCGGIAYQNHHYQRWESYGADE